MVYAHDGSRARSVATARVGDGTFLFLSRPGVDIAMTGGVPGYESLFVPDDLARWVRGGFRLDVEVTEPDLHRAWALRQAVWQLVGASLAGGEIPPAARAVVNSAARSRPLTRQLDPAEPSGWRWQQPTDIAEVLSSVARDLIEVLSVEDQSRLRLCAGENCALVFYDDSRSGRRRWCAPQRCGDRTRARDYRSRQRIAVQENTNRK